MRSAACRDLVYSKNEAELPQAEVAEINVWRSATWRLKRGSRVGLALSGGGKRSATISPGVLQALAKADLLREVDYLSTVSGGGYIGSVPRWWWGATPGAVRGETGPVISPGTDHAIVQTVFWIFVAIAAVTGLFTNINYISLYRFCRDRLMEAFMPDRATVLRLGTSGGVAGPARAADDTRLNKVWPKPADSGLRQEPKNAVSSSTSRSGTSSAM